MSRTEVREDGSGSCRDPDDTRPDWYAAYLVAEQSGKELPT